VFKAQLTCEQFSPILPHNYQETSYPLALFVWSAHNPTDRFLTLSLLLTWQNLVGWFTNTVKSPEIVMRDDGSPVYDYRPAWGQSQGNFNQIQRSPEIWAIIMDRLVQDRPLERQRDPAPREGDGQWAIATCPAAGLEIFPVCHWNPMGDGRELWHSFAADGSLPASPTDTSSPAQGADQTAVALAVRFTLAPGEHRQIPFVLAWDLPVTEFAQGIEYYRRYTDFFGRTGQGAGAIAQTGLHHYQTWQHQIQQWQTLILERDDWPNWLKMALCNELYLLTDGGTLWSAATEVDPMGQFGVLECLDYSWYESLDVRLYGSFGLLYHWPDLEKSVVRAFARAIPQEDTRTRVIGYYYTIGAESPLAQRKIADATPHDLGAPNEHPWEKTNYTAYQDCNQWKDLASDFVLQVYRDFLLTGATDYPFLLDCWPAVVQALHYLKDFDLDGDSIPENAGAPDQTFDDWRLQGISAYCGGLWLAALEAAIAMGKILGNIPNNIHSNIPHNIPNNIQSNIPDNIPDNIPKTAHLPPEIQDMPPLTATLATFQSWLDVAKPLYHQTLWNGHYYRLDQYSGSDVVMADQLCGQFYARLLGLPDLVPEDCVRSALKQIYDSCFLRFHNGTFGAANGLRPDGSPVNPQDTHPLEVWTGINFGLATFLLQMGLKAEALQLTEAVVRQVYDNGLQFRTPEAITATGTFRASHYLRAMAIWAIPYGW
jgi:non-lysosomal glucosylceramidase